MKLNEVKSIGKKIILSVLCVVLLLIFTSLSYAKPDPRYDRLREHPEQELLSPTHGDQFNNVLLIVIPNWNALHLIVCIKKDSPQENPTLQNLTTQEVQSKINSNVKRAR
jgi:hypothetical protein